MTQKQNSQDSLEERVIKAAVVSAGWLFNWLNTKAFVSEKGMNPPIWPIALAIRALINYSYFERKGASRRVMGKFTQEQREKFQKHFEAIYTMQKDGNWEDDAWLTALIIRSAHDLNDVWKISKYDKNENKRKGAIEWLCNQVDEKWKDQDKFFDFGSAFVAQSLQAFVREYRYLNIADNRDNKQIANIKKKIICCASAIIAGEKTLPGARFEGDWFDSTEQTGQSICALTEIQIEYQDENRAAVRNGINWLMRKALDNGSWRADVTETAHALEALAFTNFEDNPKFIRGMEFLLNTQDDEHPGSWVNEPTFTAWGLLGFASLNSNYYKTPLDPISSKKILKGKEVPKGSPKNDQSPKKVILSILRTGCSGDCEECKTREDKSRTRRDDLRDVIIYRNTEKDICIFKNPKRVFYLESIKKICDDAEKEFANICDTGSWIITKRGAKGLKKLNLSDAEAHQKTMVEIGSRLKKKIFAEINEYSEFFEPEDSILIETNCRHIYRLPFELLPGSSKKKFLSEECTIGTRNVNADVPRMMKKKRQKRTNINVLILSNLGNKDVIIEAIKDKEIDIACLDHAVMEAKALEKYFLSKSIHVEAMIGKEGKWYGHDDVEAKLNQGTWDLVHYTGHIISGNAIPTKDLPLTSATLKNCLCEEVKEPPHFVFLNACNSAVDPISGFADSLYAGGVQSILATRGMITADISAKVAEVVYRQLFQGDCIGRALMCARNEVKAEKINDLTWALYTLIGDPTFMLEPLFV